MSDAIDATEPARFTRLRTTIIIVSMIVMPLCAVVGVKVPKFINDLTNESAGVTTADSKAKPVAQASGTAAPADRSKSKPLDRAVSLAQAEAGHSAHDHAGHDDHDHAASPATSYAALTSQATMSASNSDVRAGTSGVSQAVALEAMAGGAVPVGYDTVGSIRPLPPLEEQGRSSTPSSGGAATGDQFSQIQTRLKALGATHYTLETWGAGGNSYRFQCRMAAGHSADYTRQFEATDTDALRTMQTVLDEVEAWKAGRLP